MRADTDKDGKISKEEFVNSTKKESEDRFSKIDGNADGFVEKPEIEEAGRKMREMQGGQRRPEGPGPEGFRRPEGDGTRPRPGGEGQPGQPGQPGSEGFRRPEGGGGGGEGFRRPEGGRPGEGGSSGRGFGGSGGFDLFKDRDKDGDGVLTKEEYFSGYEERFAQTDANKDGKISKEEADAYGARLREQFSGGRGGSGGSSGGFRRPEGGEGGTRRPEGERPKRPEGESPAPPKAE
jgi:hypothetical protein